MALAVLAPTLRPGYVLGYDMVFTPRQPLVPDAFGLGSAAPRAVPVDAILGLVTTVVPGQVVQKAILLALLVAAGWGAGALVPTASRLVRCAAASAYVWNAFVAERLVLGHWSLLVAYAGLPWAVGLARGVRAGRPGSLAGLVALCALAAITPGGGLLVLLTVAPVLAWPGRRSAARGLLGFLAGWVVVDAPWWLPAVLQGTSPAPDGGAVAGFAARADQPLGTLGSLLGLGGVWNAQVVPGSRGLLSTAVLTVLAVVAAAAGWRPLRERWGGAAPGLLVAAVLGVLLACAGTYAPGALGWVVAHVPGGGLLRDGQRFVAPWAVLLAVAAPLGAERLTRRASDRAVRRAVVGVAVALPLLVMPDLAWGAAGRLVPVAYPGDWDRVRLLLSADGRGGPSGDGDVAVLPWQAFRRFGWNGDRTVLDPAPRYLTRVTVVSRDLVVGTAIVPGDDPRSTAVGAALATGHPATATLPQLGIGWLLVERGTPGPVDPGLLVGAALAYDGPDLRLYRLGPADGPGWPGTTPLVLTVDTVALAVAVGAGLAGWGARRRGRPSDPTGRRAAATVEAPGEPREGPWELS